MKRKFDTEIEFGHLEPGVYNFEYKLDTAFFASFENEKLQGGEAFFHVKMEKNAHTLTLFITFEGQITTQCDRCLGEMEVPVEGEETLNVSFSEQELDDDAQDDGAAMDDVTLPANAHKMDLAQLFYEMAAVAMPMQCTHPDDKDGNPTCDPEMLKYMGGGNDTEERGETGEDETDPRWDALRQLKEKK